MPDYTILAAEMVGSDKWKAEEYAVIKRVFELKRLTVVSRGKRKHQIDIKSAGLSPDSVGLEGAEFEWAVAMHARVVLSELDVLGLKMSMWEGFGVENPLRVQLRAAAEQIGTSLGYAVALWNELGTEWRDLWDHFDLEAKPGKKQQRWQGFLAFYRFFQEARSAGDSYHTIPELAEQTLLRICEAVEIGEHNPFADDSDIVRLLKLCDLSPKDLSQLKLRYTQWTAIHDMHYWEAARDKPEPPLKRDYGVNFVAKTPIRGGLYAEMFQDKVMNNLLDFAWINGMRFEVNNHLSDAAAIRIFCAPRDGVLDIHCLVSLNNQKCTEMFHPFVALLHEIGHFVNGVHWMVELALADFIIEHCSSYPGVDSLRLIDVRREVQQRIGLFHSAAEVGADEFVVSILLPDEKIRKIYERNCEGDNFRMFSYHTDVVLALSLHSEDVYYDRFEPIVSDRAPDLTGPFKHVIRSSQLREARRKVSEERIMRLLNGFWREVSEIVCPAT